MLVCGQKNRAKMEEGTTFLEIMWDNISTRNKTIPFCSSTKAKSNPFLSLASFCLKTSGKKTIPPLPPHSLPFDCWIVFPFPPPLFLGFGDLGIQPAFDFCSPFRSPPPGPPLPSHCHLFSIPPHTHPFPLPPPYFHLTHILSRCREKGSLAFPSFPLFSSRLPQPTTLLLSHI